MKRRDFIRHSSLASTALFIPSFLRANALNARGQGRAGKILIVVQLSGGNDGLNTIVPYRNDVYYRERPRLAIPKTDVLTVTDELGFHPALKPLRELYDAGQMTILNSVGYPNPDRSHFRSMDIWHTASDSDAYLSTGWLGRYLDTQCSGCDNPYHALEVDDSLSLALKGRQRNGFAFSNANQLKKTAANPFLRAVGQQYQAHDHDHEHDHVAYLYKMMIDTQESADYLFEQSRVYQAKGDYPPTPFGRDLKQVAELITADTATQIYYVSLTGFDTHANQQQQQARLLQQYAQGMKALVDDLERNRLLDDTLIMTFSEFGRRVGQNASNGTDHGTANNLFLMGGRLRQPGFFNEGPDLSRLDNGDLIYRVDFRQVYATITERWLGADAQAVLGRRFDGLPVI